MTTTNWDFAFTHVISLNEFRHEHGEERIKDAIHYLFDAGGTFAVSQGNIHMSQFSFEVFMKLINIWSEVDRLLPLPKGTP